MVLKKNLSNCFGDFKKISQFFQKNYKFKVELYFVQNVFQHFIKYSYNFSNNFCIF